MSRRDDWEERLMMVIRHHQVLPSQFGVSDCYIIADDGVKAVTGEFMFSGVRGKYKTPKGAAKLLMQRGFANVEEAFKSKFEEISPSQASRGDIGVIDRNGELTGGLFTSIGFMTRGLEAVEFVPVSEVKTAFKVE